MVPREDDAALVDVGGEGDLREDLRRACGEPHRARVRPKPEPARAADDVAVAVDRGRRAVRVAGVRREQRELVARLRRMPRGRARADRGDRPGADSADDDPVRADRVRVGALPLGGCRQENGRFPTARDERLADLLRVELAADHGAGGVHVEARHARADDLDAVGRRNGMRGRAEHRGDEHGGSAEKWRHGGSPRVGVIRRRASARDPIRAACNASDTDSIRESAAFYALGCTDGPWTLALGPWPLDLGPCPLAFGPWTLARFTPSRRDAAPLPRGRAPARRRSPCRR